MQEGPTPEAKSGRRWWYLVLILPFIATLFPGLYNSESPAMGGLPYFYWYQLLWVVIAGFLTILVYFVTQ